MSNCPSDAEILALVLLSCPLGCLIGTILGLWLVDLPQRIRNEVWRWKHRRDPPMPRLMENPYYDERRDPRLFILSTSLEDAKRRYENGDLWLP